MLSQPTRTGTSPSIVRPHHLPPSTTSAPPAPTAIGYFAIVRAIRGAARLTSTERLVLMTIASHLDNATGEAAIGIPRLAAECSLATRTVERTVGAMVAAGWLLRASAASQWGTNVYRITPRPDDVRAAAPRRLRGRPFAEQVTPDRVSGEPPIPAQATPDRGSGILPFWNLLHEESPVCAAAPPENTHTGFYFEIDSDQKLRPAQEAPAGPPANDALDVDQERAVGPAQEAPAIVAELAEHPELSAITRPPVVALLAAEHRPLSVVRRALAELAEHARAAAAVGEPFSAATLARKARAYVRRAWPDASTSTSSSMVPASSSSSMAPEPPPEPPRLALAAENLRACLTALGTTPSTPRRRLQ